MKSSQFNCFGIFDFYSVCAEISVVRKHKAEDSEESFSDRQAAIKWSVETFK